MTREEAIAEMVRISSTAGDMAILDAHARGQISAIQSLSGGVQGLTPAEENQIALTASLRCLIDTGLLPIPDNQKFDVVWSRGIQATYSAPLDG